MGNINLKILINNFKKLPCMVKAIILAGCSLLLTLIYSKMKELNLRTECLVIIILLFITLFFFLKNIIKSFIQETKKAVKDTKRAIEETKNLIKGEKR